MWLLVVADGAAQVALAVCSRWLQVREQWLLQLREGCRKDRGGTVARWCENDGALLQFCVEMVVAPPLLQKLLAREWSTNGAVDGTFMVAAGEMEE